MKILVVTHYYSTHAGGIEIVAGALAEHLASTHEVAWAASDCDALPEISPSVRLLPMRSLNVIERLTGLPFPLWGPGSLVRLWRAIGSADVLHLHDIAYFGNWAAFVFARLRGRPTLITQHAGLIRYRTPLLRGMLRTLHRTVGRALLTRATAVVFISPVVRTYFRQFVSFGREPEIIWNGVNTDIYSPPTPPERAHARTQFGLAPSQAVVLFVGRFVETKGLSTIERLAQRLPDVTWALAGWGPIDPRAWNAANVLVFSSLRGPTLVPLYRAADLPGTSESRRRSPARSAGSVGMWTAGSGRSRHRQRGRCAGRCRARMPGRTRRCGCVGGSGPTRGARGRDRRPPYGAGPLRQRQMVVDGGGGPLFRPVSKHRQCRGGGAHANAVTTSPRPRQFRR